MSQSPRIVAELGRPETPDETAARKAESSRIYRSSKTTRNLIAALLVTLGIVAIVVFGVPRGEIPAAPPIDVASIAAGIESSQGRTVVVPAVPADWRVNRAGVEGDVTSAWTVVYVPGEDRGFLRIAQGFDADATWPTRLLAGAATSDTVMLGNVEWQRYDIPDPARAGNVSGALSATAGPDTFLVYGSTDEASLERAAESIADQILAIRQDTP